MDAADYLWLETILGNDDAQPLAKMTYHRDTESTEKTKGQLRVLCALCG